MIRCTLSLAAVLAVASCGLLDPDPTLTGEWAGQASGGGNTAAWTVRLTDSGGSITGTYSTTNPALGSLGLSGSLTGTYAHPTVTLNFDLHDPFDGVTLNCQIDGTVNVAVDNISGPVRCDYLGQNVLGGILNLSRVS